MNEAETFVTPRFDRYPPIRGGGPPIRAIFINISPLPPYDGPTQQHWLLYTVHIRICMHNTSTS